MKISYSQLLNIVLVALLATSVFLMNTRSTVETKTASAGTYDPWLDYNEDGYVGIDDIFSTASSFGAEGDPTKNVNVTNLPPSFCISSRRVNISWVGYGSSYAISPDWPWFNASGYSRMSVQLTIVDWNPHPTNGSYVTTVSADSALWYIEPAVGSFGDNQAPLAANVAVTFPMQVPAYLSSSVTLKTTEIIAPRFFVFFTITSDLGQGSVLVDVYAYLRNE